MSIYSDFQNQKLSNKSNEIDCFRGLMKAMKGIGYVNELHGTKYQVVFDNPLIPHNKNDIACELCDLLILVYNKTNARFTFLQNKRKFSKNYIPNTKISLPLRQRYLLGDFPSIKMKDPSLYIPNDILVNRTLDSIGSLGVFYYEYNTGNINMDYSIMNLMNNPNSFNGYDYDKNHSRVFHFNGIVNLITTKANGFQELDACGNLIDFEKNLLNMTIGEPLNNGNHPLFDYILTLIENGIKKDKKDLIENGIKKDEKDNSEKGLDEIVLEIDNILNDINNIRKEKNIRKDEKYNFSMPSFNFAIINAKKQLNIFNELKMKNSDM